MRRSGSRRCVCLAIVIAALLVAPALPSPAETPAGLFASAGQLERARGQPGLEAFLARAEAALDREARPFAVPPEDLRFGWTEPEGPPDDTLREATDRLLRDSDAMRTLALAFALTGEPRFAAKSEALMLAWARDSRPVNFYDYNPDFRTADLAGKTEGFSSDRPWNFGLDMVWQAYGLINAADAALLLEHGGRSPDPEIDAWLVALTEAVNSGFHAWTRWADENEGRLGRFHAGSRQDDLVQESAGVERHRADNHLSWALAGLLAGAAVLEDPGLAAYVLEGGAWEDRRAGRYRNSSPIGDVIDRAIEGGAGETAGRVFEERIRREPPIGYALFHLEAMSLVARIADLHFGANVWDMAGADGAGMRDAYRRYAPWLDELTGREAKSRWLAALSPRGWAGPERAVFVAARPLPEQMNHAVGPARLLFGGGGYPGGYHLRR
jgi:hypothetical protein